MTLSMLLHDGNPWLLLACVVILAGIAGLSTRSGSGIDSHPFTKPGTGGGLASDLPPESIGRSELEPHLWARRAGRRAR